VANAIAGRISRLRRLQTGEDPVVALLRAVAEAAPEIARRVATTLGIANPAMGGRAATNPGDRPKHSVL
jgi:hypothetical protein